MKPVDAALSSHGERIARGLESRNIHPAYNGRLLSFAVYNKGMTALIPPVTLIKVLTAVRIGDVDRALAEISKEDMTKVLERAKMSKHEIMKFFDSLYRNHRTTHTKSCLNCTSSATLSRNQTSPACAAGSPTP